MMNKNSFGLLLLIVVIAVVLFITACGPSNEYTVSYIRYYGNATVKRQQVVRCENKSEAIQRVKNDAWTTSDSIKIEQVYQSR